MKALVEGLVRDCCLDGSESVKNCIAAKGVSDGKVFVKARFENVEDAATYGKVTAEVEAQTATYKATSARTSFPPHEEIEVTVIIEDISLADYNQLVAKKIFPTHISLSEVENIVCPHCDGTGLGSVKSECPTCGGTGFVDCPTCGGSVVDEGGQNENLNVPLDIGEAALGVAVIAEVAIAAFVVVKKRKVSEKDLRKLPPTEFQNWVVQRLSGRVSSQKDSLMGIDGYTVEGHPIQVKQSDDIGRNVIDNFATAMGRSKAKNGIIVAFSFGKGA